MERICRVLVVAVVRGGMGVVALVYSEGRKDEHCLDRWSVLAVRWG